MIKLSIIIVSFRGWSRLRACLDSLSCLNSARFPWEVIVVDNQSGDGELNALIQAFPAYTFAENSGNYGYAHGCNEGARRARGQFLFFLNPDTLVKLGAIEAMISVAEVNPDIQLVSCNQVNERGRGMRSYGSFLTLYRVTGMLRTIDRLFRRQLTVLSVKPDRHAIFPDWISGSAIIVGSRQFNELGGWCEDYWMYFEDMDLCKRAAEAGARVAVVTDVAITHIHGGSSRINAKVKAMTKCEVHVSRHVYIQNHFKGTQRILMQGYYVVNNLLLEHLLLAVMGLILFFIPQVRVYLRLYVNLVGYYYTAILGRTWISRRSFKYRK